jgi:hypothetical protein
LHGMTPMRPFAITLLSTLVALCACSSSSSPGAPDGSADRSTGDGGGPPPIVVTDYNTTCQVSSDCAAINAGDVCGCPGCGNAAINASDLAKEQADFTMRQKQCTAQPMACPGACQYSAAFCMAGQCAICHAPGCADAGAPEAGPDAPAD